MLYSLCRRVLFSMQPETAHNVTMANLDWATHLGLHKLLTHMPDEDPVEVMGLRFPNTIGLAAGMDKDGIRVNAFGALGFGHVEIGTITPLAQPGNPKPRCFRVIPAKGIINRMGFNNEGCDKVIENLRSADAFRLRGGILGINIGTQLLLTVVTAACMWIGMPFYRYLVFAPLELVIWIIEAVIYRKRLQTRRETAHPITYALCANALSAAATLFSVHMIFPWV